ncbi:MAG: hypothetical protein KKF67_03435 [Nanoarchaeota archaeon]|nr:hypothetical protein [Nanoarchaeota archaeon]
MSERLISIRFKKPKNLERDIIYVILEKEIGGLKAHAISARDFNYTVRAIAGNPLGKTTKEVINIEGRGEYFRDCNKFIEEIVEKNNGVIDYSQAIEEGSEAYRVMRNLLR